jgi:hypothetical protein
VLKTHVWLSGIKKIFRERSPRTLVLRGSGGVSPVLTRAVRGAPNAEGESIVFYSQIRAPPAVSNSFNHRLNSFPKLIEPVEKSRPLGKNLPASLIAARTNNLFHKDNGSQELANKLNSVKGVCWAMITDKHYLLNFSLAGFCSFSSPVPRPTIVQKLSDFYGFLGTLPSPCMTHEHLPLANKL